MDQAKDALNNMGEKGVQDLAKQAQVSYYHEVQRSV